MSIAITFNGQSYIIPSPGETGWGSNLDSFFVAIPAGCLQKTGGSFTLSAETDFGGSFGLKSLYLKSKTVNPASAGMLRLAKSDSVTWRNNLNTLDLPLAVNALDQLTFNGLVVASGGPGVPADATHDGYLLATDWVIFNGKQNTLVAADSTHNGYLLATDWIIFNGKQDTITTLPINKGGTNASSFSAYSVICGGTTGTGTLQSVSGLGTTGQVLTSNGAGALPTWQAAGGGGSGTVNSGTQYELTYYATTGTAVSGNSAILTNASRQLLLNTNANPIPAFSFAVDPDTGIFHYDPAVIGNSNYLGFCTNGVHHWDINQAGNLTGRSAGAIIYAKNGTYLLPAFSFTDDQTSGIYKYTTNVIGFSHGANPANVATMGQNGPGGTFQFRVPNGAETSPSYSFMGLSSCGMYSKIVPSLNQTLVLVSESTDSMFVHKTFIRSIPLHCFGNGTVAAPTITFWDSTGTGLYRPSADTLGITTAGVLRLQVNNTGLITQPTQSSFLVLNGTGATDITGAGTLHQVAWLTEIYDLHNDFTPNIFTAPITGKYLLSASIGLLDILVSHTTLQLQIVTTNRTYVVNRDEALAASKLSLTITVIADMTAGHTAQVKVVAANGTDTIDLAADSTMNYFSGSLIN